MAAEFVDLVAARRRELGLSYSSLAAVCVDEGSGATVSTGWLHRLETGATVIPPSMEILAALAAGLRIDEVRLREAAAAQFFGLHLSWEATGEALELMQCLASLPERQRLAVADLIRVMARGD